MESSTSVVIVGKIPKSHKKFLQSIMGYKEPVGKNRIWITREERDKLINIDDSYAKDLLVRYNPNCRLLSKTDKDENFTMHKPNADGTVAKKSVVSLP